MSAKETTSPTAPKKHRLSSKSFQLDLPLGIWADAFEYLPSYEVGSLMHQCLKFCRAGRYRLKSPLHVPGDAPSLAVALAQVYALRHNSSIHFGCPVHIKRILLGPGDHTLPAEVTVQQHNNNNHKLKIELNDIEICGTLVTSEPPTTESLAASHQLQDMLLKSRTHNVYDLLTGERSSLLRTRIRGQLIVSGAKRVVLKHLDIVCPDESGVIGTLSSELTITGCHIHHCGCSAIISRCKAKIQVDHCVLSNNLDDAITVEHRDTKVSVTASHCVSNYDGVWCRKGGYATLKNSVIFLQKAIGLRAEDDGSVITHATCHIFDNAKMNVHVTTGGVINGSHLGCLEDN